MYGKKLPYDYAPKDWAGNEIKVGDLLYLYRVYEFMPFDRDSFLPVWIQIPDKNKTCWKFITAFKVEPYKEGEEGLVRYMRDGYDENKTYDSSINSTEIQSIIRDDTYVLCIAGVSDKELDWLLSRNKITI